MLEHIATYYNRKKKPVVTLWFGKRDGYHMGEMATFKFKYCFALIPLIKLTRKQLMKFSAYHVKNQDKVWKRKIYYIGVTGDEILLKAEEFKEKRFIFNLRYKEMIADMVEEKL